MKKDIKEDKTKRKKETSKETKTVESKKTVAKPKAVKETKTIGKPKKSKKEETIVKPKEEKKTKTVVKTKTHKKEETIVKPKIENKSNLEKKPKTTIEKNNNSNTFMIAIIFLAVGIIVGLFVDSSKKNNNDLRPKDKEFVKIYNDIRNNYYNDIKDDYDEKIVTAMIKELDDANSYVYEDIEAVNYKESINNKYVGIGTEVTLDENNNIIFLNVFNDSPAERAGIEVNDKLIKVDGKEIAGMTLLDTVGLIKGGNEKDQVELTILRGDEEIILNVSKSTITRDTVTLEYLNNDIAKVSIVYFAKTTYQELKTKLDEVKAKGIKKLAIDLRDNYFGNIEDAREITSLFLDKGMVIYKEETKGGKKDYIARNNKEYDFEIAVVTNEYTIKSAEMMVYSLVENKDAIVIGRATGRNNSLSKNYELKNNSIIEFTIGKWLSPKGNDVVEKEINIDYIEDDINIDNRIISVLSDNVL